MGENQLELDVVLKLQLDDTGEEIFKNIQNSARRAGKQIESAFNFGKVVAGVKLIQSTFNTLNTAIQKNVELTAKMVSGAVKGFGEIASAIASVTYKISGLSLIVKGVKNIFELLTSRLNFGDLAKQSLELASSLTEVNNVVSQVFGDSAKEIAEFSETAVSALGMSTVSARQFAGRFGAALKAAGQGADNVKYLSKELVKLTSDLSSFYDIAQDEAADKLFSGVLAGQVRPLRALGVELSNTAMQEYLTQQGVTKLWKEMSLAEKQVYRFKKTMSDLSFAQGDYSRTINSTSNQLRLLVNQLKELGTVVGSIINAFFNPFIRVLNNITASAITAAKSLANLLGIDWTGGLSGSAGAGIAGIADTYNEITGSAEGLSDAEDDLATSTDKAGKAAKKALAPFHKLNILQNKDTSGDKTSGGGAGSNLTNLVDNLSDVNSELQGEQMSLRDRLKAIADAINEFFDTAPDKVQKFFDELQPKLKELAELFNYFIEQIDFNDIGRTISEIIEGIGRSIGTLDDTLDFAMFGKKFADFVNGLVDNADMFIEWGHAIGKSINNAFDFIKNAVQGIHWATLGINLAKGLEEALKQLNPQTIHDAVYGALHGVATSINSFFSELYDTEEGKKARENFKQSIIKIMQGIGEFTIEDLPTLIKNIAKSISDLFATMHESLNTPGSNGKTPKDNIKEGIIEAINEAGKALLGEQNSISQFCNDVWDLVSTALKEFFLNKDIPLTTKIAAGVVLSKVTGLDDVASSIAGTLTSILGTVFAFSKLSSITKTLKDVSKGLSDVGNTAKSTGSEIGSVLEHVEGDIVDAEGNVIEYGNTWKNLGATILGFGSSLSGFGGTLGGIVGLTEGFGALAMGIDVVANAGITLKDTFKNLEDGFGIQEFMAAGMTEKLAMLNESYNRLGTTYRVITEDARAYHDYIKIRTEEGKEAANEYLRNWVEISENTRGAIIHNVDGTTEYLGKAAESALAKEQEVSSGINTEIDKRYQKVEETQARAAGIYDEATNAINTSIDRRYQNEDAKAADTGTKISETYSKTADDVIASGERASSGIEESTSKVLELIKGNTEEFINWLKDEGLTSIIDKLTELGTLLREEIITAIEDVKTAWDELNDAVTSYADSMTEILDSAKQSADSLVESLREAASAMQEYNRYASSSSNYGRNGMPSNIPHYASGAVLQPNKPHLALLGDQRSGINVETPLTTMIDAFTTALQGMDTGFNGDITIPIYVDGTLSDQKVIKAVQLHNYRSNGR